MKGLLLLGFTLICLSQLKAEDESQAYSRSDFEFKFNKAWEIDEDDVDFNPDSYFAIQSPGNTNIRVEIFTMRPGDTVDDMLFNAMYVLDGTLIKVSGRSSIDNIGPLKGAGKHLKGDVMHMFPGGAKVFFYREGDHGLMLTLIYWKEEFQDGDACLELIAKTFKFH